MQTEQDCEYYYDDYGSGLGLGSDPDLDPDPGF